MNHWFVCFTDSRCEQECADEIQADTGFPAFCPTEKHKRFRHGRKTIIESALFPRYLFARFDAADNWPALLEVEGVCDVLRNDGKPSPVPDGIVPKLMRMQQNGLFDHTHAPNPFPPKSKVEIDDDGPFAGLIAEVRRVRSNDRCDVLLRWLGREMMVNVPMARLSHV